VLDHGAKELPCCASQVFDRCGQAVARGSCLSQVLDRAAQTFARVAARCSSWVLGRGAQAVACGAAMLSLKEMVNSAGVL
jgi:hypothetical protein